MARNKGSPDRRKNGRQRTAKNPTAAGGARKEVDIDQLAKLCALHCTTEELTGFFEMSIETIKESCLRQTGVKFGEFYAQNRSKGKISLRRRQWLSAEKSVPMQIFLGKNYLKQTDGHKLQVDAHVSHGTVIAERLVESIPDIIDEIYPLSEGEE